MRPYPIMSATHFNLRTRAVFFILSCVVLACFRSEAFAQGGGAGAGGAGPGGNGVSGGAIGGNLTNILNNLPAGTNLGNILNNLPPGTNLGNILAGNAKSTTPTIIAASGLLAGDSGTADVIIPSQAASLIAGGNTTTSTDTNTYLWTISGGTLTSDPTKASVTYTATTAGTVVLNVSVTVVGSSAVTTTATVAIVSPDLAGTIAAPATVSTIAASATASVPAAQNGDRTFRWAASGDASIVAGTTTDTVIFKPGTPGLKELTCAVRLQNLVTVTLRSFVVVSGAGANSTVSVTNGSGGGTYPAGSRVDILADPPAPGQVFDKWTGDTSVFGSGPVAASVTHTVITVPTTPVALTATYKTAPTWTPTVITSFNPQTVTGATANTTVTSTLAYSVPTGAVGIVVLLHDTGGTVGEWFSSPEKSILTRDLVAAGYGVAALNSVNRATAAWNLQTKLASNPDAANVAAALDRIVRDGAIKSTTPVFLLGITEGATAAISYAELLASATPSRPVRGTVLYAASGSETLAVTTRIPQYFALAANDTNLGTAGNATARNNSQLLIGRGITSAAVTNTTAPVYANRFRALATPGTTFTTADATSVFSALKTAAFFDSNGYLRAIPTDAALKAALPAAYQTRSADVAAELSVAYATSEFYSDADARVVAFLNGCVAGTAGPVPGRMINLSTLSKIYAVGSTFALGFNLGGPEKATLLIRGIGPALAKFGVATAVPAPRLTVYSGSTVLATNQGWDQPGTSATQVASAAASVGAFALDAGSADSAVVLTLAPGTYTVSLDGVNGSTGDVLAEVYDVSKNSTRLTNLSTLAAINNEGDALVPGIVITGANPRTLLVRAVGPGLADVGVPASTVLGDPRISILSGGTAVSTNNNWSQATTTGSAAALAAAFPAVGAFALKTGSNDAALIGALSAGSFTLHADAAPVAANAANPPSQTGTVLVEVYEVP